MSINSSLPAEPFRLRAQLFRATQAILYSQSNATDQVAALLESHDSAALLQAIGAQGLSAIFYTATQSLAEATGKTTPLCEPLRAETQAGTALYLAQQHLMHAAHEVLAASNIPYAVFKGAHVREQRYPQPSQRQSADIDVLIAPSNRARTVSALREAGMEYHADPAVLSHEVMLSKNGNTIDLHWHIMRPGRMRMDMGEWLLSDMDHFPGYTGMNPTANLFVLLTHLSINKYVCSPDARLIKLLDVELCLREANFQEDELCHRLVLAGMKTAAWSTLHMLHLLTSDDSYAALRQRLRPGPAQQRYIQYWVGRDLPTRFYHHRALMRTAFSLSLQDSAYDALKAAARLGSYKLGA